MNEFERRALDIAQESNYLATYAREGRKIIDIEYFTYNVTSGALAGVVGSSVQSIIQIQSDSDFVLQYLSGVAVVAATSAIAINANVTVQMTDTGSNKTIFSNPTPISLVMGNQGFPYLLPAPRVFAPNTNVKFDFVNRSATAYSGIDVSMVGARIYYAD